MIMYYFVNFFVFLVINTGIEIATLRKLQKELKEKRTKAAEMNTSLDELTKKKRFEEDNKREQKTIKMVVLNSFINFVLRFPEIYILIASSNSIVYFFNNPILYFFISLEHLMNCVVDFSYLTFILTFSTNVVIYYFFNRKFRNAFKAMFFKVKIK
jgi:hypothetical protein